MTTSPIILLAGNALLPWAEYADDSKEELTEADLADCPQDHVRVEWVVDNLWLRFKVLEVRTQETLPIAEGHLKWDGCLNIVFEDRSFHFCGPESEPLIGRILKAIYALGPKLDSWLGP